MQEFTKELGTAPLGKLLLKLSVPSVISMITVSLYNTVDTFWVAKLGHEAIASLTIVLPFQMMFHAVALGTGVGVTALVSRRFGENKIETTNHVAGQIFPICLFWGILFMLAASFFSSSILPALGATPDIMAPSTEYLVNVTFGASQVIFVVVAGNLIRGSGDSMKPMILMIGASIVNIILDPLMILGIGPFPEMGIRGAALATVIAQSVGAAGGMYYLIAGKTTFRILPRFLIPDFSILKDIYRVGAPAAMLEVTQSVAFILFNKLIASFGSLAIAGVGLPFRISDLVFVPLMGASNGLLPIIGFNFGANKIKRLWQAVKTATISVVLLLIIISAAVEIFAPQILSVFTEDPEILKTAVPAMRILLAGTVFIVPTLMFITVFQGLSRGTMALMLSLLRQFILFIPLLYIFSHYFGLWGILWALPASDFLSFILTYGFTVREYLRHKKNDFNVLFGKD